MLAGMLHHKKRNAIAFHLVTFLGIGMIGLAWAEPDGRDALDRLILCQSNLRSLAKRMEFQRALTKSQKYPKALIELVKSGESAKSGIFVCPLGKKGYLEEFSSNGQEYSILCRSGHKSELRIDADPLYSSVKGPIFPQIRK